MRLKAASLPACACPISSNSTSIAAHSKQPPFKLERRTTKLLGYTHSEPRPPGSGPRKLSRHDNLTDLLIGLHIAMRFDNLFQREDLIDARLEIARSQMVENVFFGAGESLGI